MENPDGLVVTALPVHYPDDATCTRFSEICDRLPGSVDEITDIQMVVMGEPTSWAYAEGRHTFLGEVYEFIAYRFTTVEDEEGWEHYYKHFMRFSKLTPPYWSASSKVITLWVSSDHEESGMRRENPAFYDRDIILDVYRLSRD